MLHKNKPPLFGGGSSCILKNVEFNFTEFRFSIIWRGSAWPGGTPYVRLAILCAYYLASKNPDVRLETSKKRDRPVFVFQGKAQRINVKTYTVGENVAKEYKKNGEGKTPRWRHYWCGNGRERRECKFIY